ncbi:unnamed protein product [Moneuplotes crassus]|uniref:RING-type domain-containing protein n=1 Tax=Euplotes crassus TaxID=5936 RepID=A0AAD1XT31_EUPCR|nr:unnamed protein product [Moneuplotes crassus]
MYVHIILCYVYMLRICLSYEGEAGVPGVLLCIHFCSTLYNQIVLSEYFKVDNEDMEDYLSCPDRHIKMWKYPFLCDLVFFNYRFFKEIKDVVRKFEDKLKIIPTTLRIFFCLYNVGYIFRAKGAKDVEMAIVFNYVYFIVSFLKSISFLKYFIFGIWILITLPFLIALAYVEAAFSKCKRRERVQAERPPLFHVQGINDNQHHPGQFLMNRNPFQNQPDIFAVPVLGAQRHPIQPQNNRPAPPLIQNHPRNNDWEMDNFLRRMQSFASELDHPERMNSINLVKLMLDSWRKKFTKSDKNNTPSCCVCLDDFEIGEDVIELHCNSGQNGHIFHVHCIDNWSKKEKTCPLCRTNFVDLIKQEKRDGTLNKRVDQEDQKSENEEVKEFIRFNSIPMRGPELGVESVLNREDRKEESVIDEVLDSEYLESSASRISLEPAEIGQNHWMNPEVNELSDDFLPVIPLPDNSGRREILSANFSNREGSRPISSMIRPSSR